MTTGFPASQAQMGAHLTHSDIADLRFDPRSRAIIQGVLSDGPLWLYVVSGAPLWCLLWIRVLRAWDHRQHERWRRRMIRQHLAGRIEGGPPRSPTRRAS